MTTPADSLGEKSKPEQLAELKEELSSKKEEAQEKEKRKYTKRKQKDIEIDETSKQVSESVSQFGTLSFGIVINRIFPDNPLTEEESKALNEATEKVALKYVSLLGNYKEEAGLISALFFICLPRFIEKKQKQKELKKIEDVKE